MTENYFSDTCLRGESVGRVRELAGFNKFQREPDDCSPRSQRLVQLAGSEDVASRAESLFGLIRKGFRYKRKEIVLACDEGGASIGTPDFEVILNMEQHPEVASNYRLLTEVGRFRRDDLVLAPHFVSIFAPYCDRVVIGFGKKIDLEAKIDRIEENDDLSEFLDYDAACSWFTLRLPQLVLEVNSGEMICRLPGETSLSDLIANTQSALTRLAGAGINLGGARD